MKEPNTESEESLPIYDIKPQKYQILIDGDNYVEIEKFMERKLTNAYDGAYLNDGSRPRVMADWNYFMPVLEKIESQGCIVELSMCLGMFCRITKVNGTRIPNNRFSHETFSAIESVYFAVAEYARWFNKQE